MGPAIIIIPLALAAVGLAAAASKKKAAPVGTPLSSSGALPASNSTTLETLPPDINQMVVSAVSSNNPETMHRVANAIRGRYPNQSTWLDGIAANFETGQAVQAGQQAALEATAAGASPVQAVAAAQTAAASTMASSSPGIIPSAAPPQVMAPAMPPVAQAVAATLAGPNVAIPAAQQAASAAIAAGATPAEAVAAAQTAAVQSVTPAAVAARPEPLPVAMPAIAPAVPDMSGKGLAADMAKALSAPGVKKGTKTEPRAVVAAFQTQERLDQTDGSYGYETAMALADRYGIVPPKPLYWGKKGGPPALPAQQKQAYSTHLLVLASKDPARADEWRTAAKV